MGIAGTMPGMNLHELCEGPIESFRRVAGMMRLRRRIDAAVMQHLGAPVPPNGEAVVTRLREGAVWSVGPHDPPVSLRVLSGDLWITDRGSDLVRCDGETFRGGREGKVVIQALSDSVIEIAPNRG